MVHLGSLRSNSVHFGLIRQIDFFFLVGCLLNFWLKFSFFFSYFLVEFGPNISFFEKLFSFGL